MGATQRHDEEVGVTDEADEAGKGVELSLSSPAPRTAIPDSLATLPAASTLKNTSPGTLTPGSTIQDLAPDKQLSPAPTEQPTDPTGQSDDLTDQLLTELTEACPGL